jgi:Fe-S cluster assembly protein SufD
LEPLNNIIIPAGEQRTLLLLNEPNVHWHIQQQANSSLLLHVIALPELDDISNTQQVTITVEHVALGCKTEIYGMGLLAGQQHCDICTRVLHTVGGGYSSQLIKMVLAGSAKASFKGELRILPNAQQVEAYQTNRNILLSSQAEMITEPQLEIYADDVKASHGATTGQLDESAIFYMQQRGISRDTAYRLLLGAFFDDVLSTIPDESQREKLIEQSMHSIDSIIQ